MFVEYRKRQQFVCLFFTVALAVGCSQSISGNDSDKDKPEPPAQPVPSEVRTSLSTSEVRVGEELSVQCELLDSHDNPLGLDRQGEFVRLNEDQPPREEAANSPSRGEADSDGETGDNGRSQLDPQIRYAPEGNFKEADGNTLIPTNAGAGSINCSFPSLGMVDTEPLDIQIKPGEPHTSEAEVRPNAIPAGASFNVQCRLFDSHDNEIEEASARLDANSTDGSISIDNQNDRMAIQSTGIYEITCEHSELEQQKSDQIEIVPADPANLSISLLPNSNEYQLNQVIEVLSEVTDQYGNVVPDADVQYHLSPASGIEVFGRGRYRFTQEDVYTLNADVAGGGEELSAQKTINVNQFGPGISCEYPEEGGTVTKTADESLRFQGSLSDQTDPAEATVEVNGQPVEVLENGDFAVDIGLDYGINFAHISATDQFGEETKTTCAFLSASNWHPRNQYLDGSVALKLPQRSLDDGQPTDRRLDSLGDMLHTILNSRGLKKTINTQLAAANPLSLEPKVTYLEEYRLSKRTHTAQLNFTDSGIELVVSLIAPEFRFEANTGFPLYLEKGWLKIDRIEVTAESSLGLEGGEFKLQVDNIRESTLQGVNVVMDNAVVEWVADTFLDVDGKARKSLSEAIEDVNIGQINERLEGVISNLDLDSYDLEFSLPNFGSQENLDISFGFHPSEIATNSSRGLFSLGTRFSGPSDKATSIKGVPLPSGNTLRDPNSNTALAGSFHIGLVNHALYSIWKAGYFDLKILGDGNSQLETDGTVVSGASMDVETGLPPVATFGPNGRIDVSLGGITATLNHPSLEEAVKVRAGGTVRTKLSLTGGEETSVEFKVQRLSDLYLVSSSPVATEKKSKLKELVRNLFRRLAEESLNAAIPALPIPSFQLPNSLSLYGLPGGDMLGVRGPSIRRNQHHLVFESQFGIQ